MRHALPILYCVDEDTRAKLRAMITDTHCIPDDRWVTWVPPSLTIHMMPMDLRDIEAAREYYDRFMRQRPKPKRMK